MLSTFAHVYQALDEWEVSMISNSHAHSLSNEFKLQIKLIRAAVSEYQKILPCDFAKTWQDCFTVRGNRLLFWFNTTDNSTHVIEQRC
jgi:hypothetical protein